MSLWTKVAIAVGVLLLGIVLVVAIVSTAPKSIEADAERVQAPLVSTQTLQPRAHRFEVRVFGEVQPKEKTRLTPEVSGRVIGIHPNFVAGGVIAKGEVMAQLDDADYQAAVLSAEAGVAAAYAALEQEKALARVAAQELRHLSPGEVSALGLRKPQLHSAEAGVKSAQAALQKAKRDLERTQIVAPYDALVVSRSVGLGQVVSAATALGEIYSVEQAEIHLPVAGFDARFLPQPVAGIPAQVQFDGHQRRAEVVRDLGVIHGQTRMGHLVVQVDDPYSLNSAQPVLRFGHYVEVILSGQTHPALFEVPQDSVQNQQVWLLNEDNTLRRQPVQVVRQEGKSVLIEQGLQAGDKLVLLAPSFPQPGMQVRTDNNGSELAKVE
ncbi:efflux RND transporter periplasmic adaptor subunit [Alkalimonas sp. MEB108]|uniref:Efflux RND transporter periplasmic adaptor subunit n=1 Tax=Alkalimonas cellulosilytica TaxID=3058395 RepID=A0ABU7J3A2_9GAMM|nr:efflux RND transporter periplasmic adaptor subunit [Alkalimonas sp. MEB108]MEE2000983.1 efflux RND transporter periplasmic adaptor subunit [Alkalimonas sp. MEB108]